MILFVALLLALGAGTTIGAILTVHLAEWLDEHGPKWWPGR